MRSSECRPFRSRGLHSLTSCWHSLIIDQVYDADYRHLAPSKENWFSEDEFAEQSEDEERRETNATRLARQEVNNTMRGTSQEVASDVSELSELDADADEETEEEDFLDPALYDTGTNVRKVSFSADQKVRLVDHVCRADAFISNFQTPPSPNGTQIQDPAKRPRLG